MTTPSGKIAGAPISWGVCEVPGWGYQLTPDRVLAEMTEVGLAATEFGPDGFLPADPAVMAEVLAARHLTAVGGFTPVVLHEATHDPVPAIDRLLDSYDAAHADVLVLSAATGQDGYDARPDLDESGWKTLLGNLDRLTALASKRGVRAVLHPHVGTMVERGEEVQRVLEGSGIALCLDTGHLLIGGTDPAELTRQAPGRIAHTHFKDVDDTIAAQVRSGQAHLHRRRQARHVPAAGSRRRRLRRHRQLPAEPRLRRLVRPGAGHHSHRGAPRRGPGQGCPGQRRLPPQAACGLSRVIPRRIYRSRDQFWPVRSTPKLWCWFSSSKVKPARW